MMALRSLLESKQSILTGLNLDRHDLFICVNQRMTAASCAGRGSVAIAEAIEAAIAERELPIDVHRIHCFGRCEMGPNVRLLGHPFFEQITLEDVEPILLKLAVLTDSDEQHD